MSKKPEPTLIDQLDYLLDRERLFERKIADPKESHLRDMLEKDLKGIRAKIPELRDQIVKDPSITKIEDLRIGQKVKFKPTHLTYQRLKGTSWEKLFGKIVIIVGLRSGALVLPSMSRVQSDSEEVCVKDEEESQDCQYGVYDGFRAADFVVKFRARA